MSSTPPSLNSKSRDFFDQGSPLSEAVPGFAPRRQQAHLAEAVANALDSKSILIGEAGTGTGKTFAYLLPALMSGERVIISTGTRHLQDQLYQSDLPAILKALTLDGLQKAPRQCLLKGRANYLCRHRLAKAFRHPDLRDSNHQGHLEIISDWAKTTINGDIAEVEGVPENAKVWRYITSSIDFCSQHEADELEDCFIFKARQRAQAADLVVVNHHLLCADLALKDEGFGELLPSANAFIIDEAHQLPEIAANFFGQKLTSRQLDELARDTIAEHLQEAPDMAELRTSSDRLIEAVRHFRLSFGVEPSRDAWHLARGNNKVERELERLDRALRALGNDLRMAAGRGKGLDGCARRCEQLQTLLRRFVNFPPEMAEKNLPPKESVTDVDYDTDPESVGGNAVPAEHFIHWYETTQLGFMLNSTPLRVDAQFRNAMNELQAAWVFTSATLAVGGDFSHFRAQLGIDTCDQADSCDELQVDSPFDYANNALLYLPENLPEPSAPQYTEQLVHSILPILEASEGRAFLLFTSYRALNIAHKLLGDRGGFTLYTQGNAPKRELLEAFQSTPRALLLGTSSFWEGVDVRGSALSCVVIDKLPFASPGDPVLGARIESLRKEGGNPFFEFQVPQAAISLKQGVGRLIRDVTDRGVLVLCDPRIKSKSYGRVFLESLPPMPLTRDLDEVCSFFDRDSNALESEQAGLDENF